MLSNRCPFDWEAYTQTFYKSGKIDDKNFDRIDGLYQNFTQSGLMPNYTIFIHPPYEWVVERIKQRWNEEKKKWNEDDFEYLWKLRAEYERIVTTVKTTQFLTVTVTDRVERVNIIKSWLSDINPQWAANQKYHDLEV